MAISLRGTLLSATVVVLSLASVPAGARVHVRPVCNRSTYPCPPGGHYRTISYTTSFTDLLHAAKERLEG